MCEHLIVSVKIVAEGEEDVLFNVGSCTNTGCVG